MNLTLRPATPADVELVFAWSNEPAVRESSFNTAEIAWDTHVPWFNRRIQDDNTVFLIAELDQQPCAQVRFQRDPGMQTAVVGISIAAEFRGKGIAKPLLRQASLAYLKGYPTDRIHAFIRFENEASQRAFIGAGYRPDGETDFNGVPAKRYLFDASEL